VWRVRDYRSTLIGAAVSLALISGANAEPKLWRSANLTTAMEVALATTSFMEFKYGPLEKAELSINLSDRNWVFTLKSFGDNYVSTYTVGFLWGADKDDWLVSFSGVGNLAKERSVINGKAVWKYDQKLSDHPAIDFDNVIKVGENSQWGWIKGSQIIVGGTIGGVGGIIATGMTPAGIFVGLAGAIAGADGLINVSNTVKEIVSDEPKPPERPKEPPVPEKDKIIPLVKDQIVVAIVREKILGTAGETLTLSGTVKDNGGTAVISKR